MIGVSHTAYQFWHHDIGKTHMVLESNKTKVHESSADAALILAQVAEVFVLRARAFGASRRVDPVVPLTELVESPFCNRLRANEERA